MADLSSITGLVEKFREWALQTSSSSPSPWPTPHVDLRSSPLPLPSALNLEALQRMVPRIEAVLNDAEEREIRDESVRLWLEDLRDVAYEAEDLLDEHEYELLGAKAEAGIIQSGGRPPRKRTHQEEVHDVIPPIPSLNASFWYKTAGRIQKIQTKLEEISKRRDGLHLREGDGQRRSRSTAMRPPTSHLVDGTNVRGREDDLKRVIGMVLSDECKRSDLFVIPIIGIGGVGKTTLAQLVYNNSEVSSLFQLQGWVSVSDDFESVQLTKKIFEALTKKELALTELSALQARLMDEVKGKRFLLVLDDVWNENPDLCDSLLLPLRCGDQGSAVIATSRSKLVATIMAPTHHHHRLDCLSKEDCWTVFQQNAFHGLDAHENHQELVQIGKEIARKCKGLPLAAKSLGRLLCHCGYDVKSWRDVLESNVWDVDDKIVPALMLSYIHLPGHLKQCFLYASVFPKDYYFNKDELIRLWMAQGYIRRTGNRELEIVGDSYFDELVNRSFFQSNPRDTSLFVMHDSIHDLAQYISRGEHVVVGTVKAGCLRAPKARHVSLLGSRYGTSVSHLPYLVPEAVRTVMGLAPDTSEVYEEWEFIMKRILNLRILTLRSACFLDLPEGIHSLMHLRYLNLAYNRLKILPDSIGKLYHLQTLILRGTWLEMLPTSITNLSNLRYLEVGSDFTQMPVGVGRLTSLRTLDVFNVGKVGEDCARVEELKGLVHLRGSLTINNLWCVADVDKAKEADLEGKTKIWNLNLNWYSEEKDTTHPFGPILQDQVLENLRPHGGLKRLTIRKYCGVRLPKWLGRHAVQVMGSVFRRQESLGFPVLEELVFENMPNWMEWRGVKRGDFPRLRCLHLMDCPQLKSLPPIYHLPVLEELVIERCEELISIELLRPSSSSSSSSSSFSNAASSPPSSTIRAPPPLKKMKIVACPQARFSPDHEQLQLPPTLQHLLVDGECPLLVEWCQTDVGIRSLSGILGAKLLKDQGGRMFVSTNNPDNTAIPDKLMRKFLERRKRRKFRPKAAECS